MKEATFYFEDRGTEYVLTGAKGKGKMHGWKKTQFDRDQARRQADRHVGQFVRDWAPTKITYVDKTDEGVQGE